MTYKCLQSIIVYRTNEILEKYQSIPKTKRQRIVRKPSGSRTEIVNSSSDSKPVYDIRANYIRYYRGTIINVYQYIINSNLNNLFIDNN